MLDLRSIYPKVEWDLTTNRVNGTMSGKQSDTGRGMEIYLVRDGAFVVPTTEVLNLKYFKEDGTSGYVGAMLDGGRFLIENTSQVFAIAGKVVCEFELVINSEFIKSNDFIISSLESKENSGIESTNEYTVIQEFIIEATSLKLEFETIKQSESSRVENELNRVNEEAIRVSSESTRVISEGDVTKGRVKAENARVVAETGRVTAESSRVTNESIRVSSEDVRVVNDSTRPIYVYKTQAEYDVLTTEQKSDPKYIYEITDSNGEYPNDIQAIFDDLLDGYDPRLRGLESQLAETANNKSGDTIAPGAGLNPATMQFDLVRICSDRLKMIENYNENFSVDVNQNNVGTYEKIMSLGSSANTNFSMANGTLELKNTDPKLTTVDDGNASIVYAGTKVVAPSANFYGGTEALIRLNGEYLEYQFTGTGIKYYADKGTDHGIANIYIDDVLHGTADGYSATALYKQLLYSVTGLTDGVHKIKIMVTSNKNAGSTGIYVTLDYFEVIHSETPSDIYVKTPIKFLAPGFALRMTVDSDTIVGTAKSSSRIGLIKDGSDWIMGNYNKSDGKIHIISYQNGVYSEVASAVYTEITAPYELVMLFKNNDLTLIINKNNNMQGYVQVKFTGFQFKDPAILSQFTLGFGGKLSKGETLKISNVKSGYDQGMTVGADYKLITYEDGSPLKNDNAYYFTASEHSTSFSSAGTGALVYKININSLNIELVGVVFSKVSATDIHGDQTCKIIYDRNQKSFIYLANNFQAVPIFMVGKTKANLLSGINIVTVRNLSVGGAIMSNAWDADLIYDDVAKKYKLIYTKDWFLQMAEVDDVYNSWTVTKTSDVIRGEGAIFNRINGQFYITFSTNPHTPVIQLYDINFNFITNLNIDKFPATAASTGAFPWGFILPVQNGEETSFYLFLFSMRKWWNLLYAYGDLWIYKAKQVETGMEFKENNKLMF